MARGNRAPPVNGPGSATAVVKPFTILAMTVEKAVQGERKGE